MSVKGGPYWHVIRFLDHPLLPANTPPDVPKIVKHGIDDDGPMHPRSPHVSGPDGVATLLYKMGREGWLAKFLDVQGTENFSLQIKKEPWKTLFVKRHGRIAEMGFLGTSRTSYPVPEPGITYQAEASGKWVPIGATDMDLSWGPTSPMVRGQGESFCKTIWYNDLWAGGSVEVIDWSGITHAEVAENEAWCYEFRNRPSDESSDSDEDSDSDENSDDQMARLQRSLDRKRLECRGGCGEKNSKLRCALWRTSKLLGTDSPPDSPSGHLHK